MNPIRRREAERTPPRSPKIRTVPASGKARQLRILIVVVFPAPFAPRNPTTSFSPTVKETSSRTRTLRRQNPVGYDFTSPSTSMTGRGTLIVFAAP